MGIGGAHHHRLGLVHAEHLFGAVRSGSFGGRGKGRARNLGGFSSATLPSARPAGFLPRWPPTCARATVGAGGEGGRGWGWVDLVCEYTDKRRYPVYGVDGKVLPAAKARVRDSNGGGCCVLSPLKKSLKSDSDLGQEYVFPCAFLRGGTGRSGTVSHCAERCDRFRLQHWCSHVRHRRG